MFKYRKKPPEVEAWRVAFNKPKPGWVLDMARITYSDIVCVKTTKGYVEAKIGEYLVLDQDRNLYVFQEDSFKASYEPVSPKTSWTERVDNFDVEYKGKL